MKNIFVLNIILCSLFCAAQDNAQSNNDLMPKAEEVLEIVANVYYPVINDAQSYKWYSEYNGDEDTLYYHSFLNKSPERIWLIKSSTNKEGPKVIDSINLWKKGEGWVYDNIDLFRFRNHTSLPLDGGHFINYFNLLPYYGVYNWYDSIISNYSHYKPESLSATELHYLDKAYSQKSLQGIPEFSLSYSPYNLPKVSRQEVLELQKKKMGYSMILAKKFPDYQTYTGTARAAFFNDVIAQYASCVFIDDNKKCKKIAKKYEREINLDFEQHKWHNFVFEQLPEKTILFPAGDNDTYNFSYLAKKNPDQKKLTLPPYIQIPSFLKTKIEEGLKVKNDSLIQFLNDEFYTSFYPKTSFDDDLSPKEQEVLFDANLLKSKIMSSSSNQRSIELNGFNGLLFNSFVVKNETSEPFYIPGYDLAKLYLIDDNLDEYNIYIPKAIFGNDLKIFSLNSSKVKEYPTFYFIPANGKNPLELKASKTIFDELIPLKADQTSYLRYAIKSYLLYFLEQTNDPYYSEKYEHLMFSNIAFLNYPDVEYLSYQIKNSKDDSALTQLLSKFINEIKKNEEYSNDLIYNILDLVKENRSLDSYCEIAKTISRKKYNQNCDIFFQYVDDPFE